MDVTDRPIIRKEYYSIGEVCDLVDLKPHVLRYWESQFPPLKPSKNRAGNRVYQRKEIRLIILVKRLLYEEKYTIEGARQKVEELREGGKYEAAASRTLDEATVDEIRTELQEILALLRADDVG
ncbi:MAG: MerR family transcriptional regulator [Gemmatimonadetes bacterium]|nr:MerR family transcriptional regulator [Gemmatimonadota bacterium]NIQ53170.1 MerR family transcriptional regulator [Gemmatimonadota bacterium]NIU73314.1 MerR family transcriptional regulator [Gammaproteobacteria bacterium]NIX43561.1 MerR family transcriptional regulator [Gemmatimonadota bacterium]NIY07753.1 MerR family transcriptional regulator [Gemmatimonadota bacterium]